MQVRRKCRAISLLALVLSLSLSVLAQQSVRVPPANIMIVHAKVYTLDPNKPWAQSVAMRNGKIVAVGSELEVDRYRGIGTKIIDAGGKLVLPGFTDCHVHFYPGSMSLRQPNLENATSVAEVTKILRDYAATHPGNDWIVARGWNYAMLGPGMLPNKADLDAVFFNRPVFLEAYDSHAFWVNSKALSLAGVDKDTPDPRNGWIVHDSKTGDPTGALKEDANRLIRKVIPEPERVDKLIALRLGLKLASRNGITRVHSAGEDFAILPLLQELRDEKQLSVRFHIAYRLSEYELRPQDLEAIESARKKFHDEWIDVNSVKFKLDGVVESHTAAFLDPYSDDPSTKGFLFWDSQKYRDAVAELDKHGWQLYTHAIGDLAVRIALDAYEAAAKRNHSKNRRQRVEHVETIAADDIPRFAKLGVIASMQPLHSYPDADTLDVWAKAVGPERATRAWVWKSILKDDGHYAFGSDWPVATLNPWEAIQTAVTRETQEGTPKGGFVPSQRLTVAQAVEGYTLDAAYAGHREKTEGSIEPGKVADIIIVNKNIFEIDPHHIGTTKVTTTIVGGKIVYEADPE
jgi:predicted amidohydrolase YtcJ